MYKSITNVRKQSGKLYQFIYFKQNVLLKKMLYISIAKKHYIYLQKSHHILVFRLKNQFVPQKNIPMQITHITQLIKKPFNKLERFFKKRVIIAFLYVFHVSRLFLSRVFFFEKDSVTFQS